MSELENKIKSTLSPLMGELPLFLDYLTKNQPALWIMCVYPEQYIKVFTIDEQASALEILEELKNKFIRSNMKKRKRSF